MKNYWLFKSEPSVFSIDDFSACKDKATFWDGVRNYQARNFLRDSIKKGDVVLFYHSNADPLAITGYCEVVREGYPDHTALNEKSAHYDPSSTKENPIWFMVDIKLVQKFKSPVTLDVMKKDTGLQEMKLLQRGNRLSVMPVTEKEAMRILQLANEAE
jgi:predicted RNA-binding protein with PUA-like domain